MNLPLPDDRRMPDAELVLERILADAPPKQPRARWLLVVVIGVLAVALAIALPRLLDRQRGITLATPSSTAPTAPSSTAVPSAEQVPYPGSLVCRVDRPADWDALLDQYRVAAPPDGTTSVSVVEVSPDGTVLTVRAVERERWLEYGPTDRSSVQTIMPIGEQAMLADFDTDGQTFVFHLTVSGQPQVSYRWRPGADAERMDGPLLLAQAQYDGETIGLQQVDGVTTLIVQPGDEPQRSIPAPGAVDLVAAQGTAWLLVIGGHIAGYDLDTLEQVDTAMWDYQLRPASAIFSDGSRLGLVDPDGMRVVRPNPIAFDGLAMDTAQTGLWLLSGNHASWLQGVWPDAEFLIWDLRTDTVTALPSPAGKSEGLTGVRNGYLVVHDDPLRPAVLPLSELSMLYRTCGDMPLPGISAR